ncbi:hypothetical protein EVB91_027 [Rhizobium phage RHph_I1_18]|nr:hypothetical protein EVB91_027 [Rhizobium phage RHph_I1_18]
MKTFKQFVSDLAPYTSIPAEKIANHFRAGKRPTFRVLTSKEFTDKVLDKLFPVDAGEYVEPKTNLVALIWDREAGGAHTVWYDPKAGYAYIPMTITVIQFKKYKQVARRTRNPIDPNELILDIQKALGETGKINVDF